MGNDEIYITQPYYNGPGSIQTIHRHERQIAIRLKKYDFFKGDIVEGEVIIYSDNAIVLNDIYLNLYLHEHWSNIQSDPPMTQTNNPLLLTIKIGIGKILNIDSTLINLNPGNYNFPFKFQLPDYLQPCFEYPRPEKKGTLRYILEAKLISQFVQGNGRVYLFIKSRPRMLNCPLSFSSATNVHTWGMFDGGSTILKVSYQTSNYQLRGQIPFNVEINNTRGKIHIKGINVKAVRRIQFKNIQEASVKFHLEDVMVNKVFDVSVPANTNSQAYNYTIDLKEEKLKGFNYVGVLNPYPRLQDLAFAMPTTDGAAVKCDYFLVVSLLFSSFVTKGYIPKVIVPFTLTHQLVNDYNLEQKEDDDLKKAIEASLLDMKKEQNLDYDNINEVNINDVNITNSIQKKNEEILDNQKEDNSHLIDDNLDFSSINSKLFDNNEIPQNNNFKAINNIKNEIKEMNNNISQILNNNANENKINEINNGNMNIIDNNKLEVNNSLNNNINMNNMNMNNANNGNNNINNGFNSKKNENNVINNENNNKNNIKLYDNDDDVNPYLVDAMKDESKNNKNNNFSINEID